MEKKMQTTIAYVGRMEKNTETSMVYWGFIGIMEKNMETTIVYTEYSLQFGTPGTLKEDLLCRSPKKSGRMLDTNSFRKRNPDAKP